MFTVELKNVTHPHKYKNDQHASLILQVYLEQILILERVLMIYLCFKILELEMSSDANRHRWNIIYNLYVFM